MINIKDIKVGDTLYYMDRNTEKVVSTQITRIASPCKEHSAYMVITNGHEWFFPEQREGSSEYTTSSWFVNLSEEECQKAVDEYQANALRSNFKATETVEDFVNFLLDELSCYNEEMTTPYFGRLYEVVDARMKEFGFERK